MDNFGYRGGKIDGNAHDVEHVIPTLMIGLGGTGKQILTRVRKRLYDKFGRPSFPFLRTVAFDTDVQPADGVPHDETELDYANAMMTAAQAMKDGNFGFISDMICVGDLRKAFGEV